MGRHSQRPLLTLKNRRQLPGLVVFFLVTLIRLLGRTCRLRVVDPRGFLPDGEPWPVILSLWHNRLLFLADMFPATLRRRSAALASASRDGEYAAAFVEAFHVQPVRGSSSRGGHRALRQLKRKLDDGLSVILTVDGPRGPRYGVHPGAILLAEMTEKPIIPASFSAPHRWELGGWDRTQVPKPFSTIELVLGEPFYVARGLDREGRLAECARLRDAMLAITRDARGVPLPQDTRWHLVSAAEDVDLLLTSGDWLADAEPVKQNRRRTVYRVPPRDGRAGLYVKHDHPRYPRNRIRASYRCKARSEYQSALALVEAGVPTAVPLAWGRAGVDGFLVTEELAGAEPFEAVWQRCRSRPALRQAFLTGLARFLHSLSREGVDHPDLHAGNVLAVQREEALSFFLVDVYQVTTGVHSPKQWIRTVAWLMAIWRELERDEAHRLLACSGALPGGTDPAAAWQEIIAVTRRDSRALWLGRRRRLLGASSLCERASVDDGRWLVRGPFDLETARLAVAAHRAGTGNVLKAEPKREVSRVEVNGVTYVVKEFRRPGPWGRWSADARCWLNSFRLEMHRVPVARCLAWLRTDKGAGFLLMEDVGDDVLPVVLRRCTDPERRRALLAATGRLLGWVHQAGIVHGDLKLSNVMVCEQEDHPRVPLALVDSDSVRFHAAMPLARRVRNLRQVLGSLPPELPFREQARLLVTYRREARLSRVEFRDLLRRATASPGRNPRRQT